MAEPVLVLGKQGTGKTAAWRNVPEGETFIIKPNAKQVNIPDSKNRYSEDKNNITGKPNLKVMDSLSKLPELLKDISNNAPWVKYILIDDFTHFFTARITSDEFQNDNSNVGYGRWNKFGIVVTRVMYVIPELREDLIIVFNHHTDIKDDGSVGMRTSGKLLDNLVDMPSYFNNIFHTEVIREQGKTKYYFLTNEVNSKLAKTLYGLFDNEEKIENDIYPILLKIQERNK